jgi:uncharacterized SAM-binding protein YcdF (DUF218 family)
VIETLSTQAANPSAASRKASLKVWIFPVLVPVITLAVVFAYLAHAVVHDAREQQLQPADAIVVFGAAEYDGRPSPVFRARLDHGYDLFRKGLAPMVITTGGAAADPNYSEGGVGHDYLMRRGIPEMALIAETQASDTSESAQRVAVIMRANRMNTCIAVSDAYHVFRIRKMLEHEGLRAYVAPRADSKPKSAWQRGTAILRETSSYLVWRLGVRG